MSRKRFNVEKIEKGVSLILEGMNLDLTDRNYLETPDRYARFLIEMFGRKDSEYATFPETYSDFVILRRHIMYSLCPHHLLPVEFETSLAYIPQGNVLGLSKLARVLDDINTGPLLQERFTRDAVAALLEYCPEAQGVACFVSGQHGCTKIRGVRSAGRFLTSSFEGKFKNNSELQRSFFELCLH